MSTNKKMFVPLGLPYILSVIAIASSFMDWIKAYSRVNFGGQTADYDMAWSSWFGGYGIAIVFLFIIGSILYNRRFKYYWVTGVLGVLYGMYIYTVLTSNNMSAGMNSEQFGGASMEAGYEFLPGFYIYMAAATLFSLTILMKKDNAFTQTPNTVITIVLLALLGSACGNPNKQNAPNSYDFEIDDSELNFDLQTGPDGTYSANTGGAITTLTIIGSTWLGQHKEEHFGTLLGSGMGTFDGQKLFDEYGREIGYVKNKTVYANLGGIEVMLDKD